MSVFDNLEVMLSLTTRCFLSRQEYTLAKQLILSYVKMLGASSQEKNALYIFASLKCQISCLAEVYS